MGLVKIAFVVISNSKQPLPSTRITVLNMLPFLREAKYDPWIVFEPDVCEATPDVSHLLPRLVTQGFQVVYFQRVHGPHVVELARQLSSVGIRTIFGVCDIVNAAMAEVTDATIVVTEYLKSLYPRELHSKIHVVHDGIERPDVYKMQRRKDAGSRLRPLRAVLVLSSHLKKLPILGSPPSWLNIDVVGLYPNGLQRLREARWKLMSMERPRDRHEFIRFLLNPRIRCHRWDQTGVYQIMRRADIGIIPIETSPAHEIDSFPPLWKVKSENRLTMKMSVGLPVIATPIPSYEAVVEQGKNAFLASSQRAWADYLDALRDPKLRSDIGEAARKSVLSRYSMEEQARRLIAVMNGVLVETKWSQDSHRRRNLFH